MCSPLLMNSQERAAGWRERVVDLKHVSLSRFSSERLLHLFITFAFVMLVFAGQKKANKQ